MISHRRNIIDISIKLREELHKIRPLFKGTLKYTEIIDILKPVLKKFRAKPLLLLGNIEKIDCSVGGCYEMRLKRQPITIELLFSAKSDKLKFDKASWDNFLFDIFEVTMHEHVHMNQMKHRDPEEDWPMYIAFDDCSEMTEQQEYLAEVDELDAYGMSIALEILNLCPEYPMLILKNLRLMPILTYQMYLNAFNGKKWNDIQKRLLKKTYQWLLFCIENDLSYHTLKPQNKLTRKKT